MSVIVTEVIERLSKLLEEPESGKRSGADCDLEESHESVSIAGLFYPVIGRELRTHSRLYNSVRRCENEDFD
jgi:hypothetical protein